MMKHNLWLFRLVQLVAFIGASVILLAACNLQQESLTTPASTPLVTDNPSAFPTQSTTVYVAPIATQATETPNQPPLPTRTPTSLRTAQAPTPTPPSATSDASVESPGVAGFVSSSFGVDLLECDSADCPKIVLLEYQTPVEILQTANGWHHLRLADGRTGYVPDFAVATALSAPTTSDVLVGTSVIPTAATVCIPRIDWATIYRVQPGDTVSNLSRRVNTSISAIAQANCLANVNTIFVGQLLWLPSLPPPLPSPTATYTPVIPPTVTPSATDIIPTPPIPNATDTPTPIGNPTATPSPQATVSPSSASVGMNHTLTFSLFPPNEVVQVQIRRQDVGGILVQFAVTMDTSGNGTASFITDDQTFDPGTHLIDVLHPDGTLATRETLNIES